MKSLCLCAAMIAPALMGAQDIVVTGEHHQSADVIRHVAAKPHITFRGSGRLDLPRDSSVTQSIIVIGRSTYLASKVSGDVVVVGGDLFVHPGAVINGRAVAVGGSVVVSALARVDSGSVSYRDESYASAATAGGLSLEYKSLNVAPNVAVIDYAGLQGLLPPAYDRVNGLSLPVGAVVTLGGGNVVLEPRLSYRSRLGVVDPRIDISIAPDAAFGLEAHGARETRSNESWIRSDLVNSAAAFFVGSDIRNYFRSTNALIRVIGRSQRAGRALEAYLGARDEEVRPISATGNVFSFMGRKDSLKMRRPNPLISPNTIGSLLAGALWNDTSGAVISRVRADLEAGKLDDLNIHPCPSTKAPGCKMFEPGTRFTQVTLDARVAFPTFGTQSLQFRGHAVAAGGSVPDARYAYLGGSGTLAVVDPLELGGDRLIFTEFRYLYPVERVKLPLIGYPTISLRDALGSAGVGSLPSLEHEIGFGVGASVLQFDFNRDVAHHRGSKVGLGISLTI